MNDQWIHELGILTGTEVCWLTTILTDAMTEAAAAGMSERITAAEAGKIIDLMQELRELRDDVIIQVARIPMPMWQAGHIVRRSQFAHHHPVRVPGT